MAKHKKRKGKTFVTEHYLSDEVRQLMTEIIVEIYNYHEREDRKFVVRDELMVWVDIQGFRFGTSSWKTFTETVPYSELNITKEDRTKLFEEFSRIYETYADKEADPQSYHVKLNEETIYRVKDLFDM